MVTGINHGFYGFESQGKGSIINPNKARSISSGIDVLRSYLEGVAE